MHKPVTLPAILILVIYTVVLSLPVTGAGGEVTSPAEITKVVKGAVECTEWMRANTEQEVNSILSRYYTGKALEENTKSVWEFVKLPTDWHSITTAEDCEIIYQDKNMAVVKARLTDTDELDKDTQKGTALFFLTATEDGWRIYAQNYQWHW
ncbi:protein subunit release factor A [Desulfohalotomaculum tongense]|uniref:hypothetical protein n=1 Tax=Desulforadius tongensis TaxID=1216062 RepID=UPI00195DE3ED|nr:hypothetical protein [Desulforadius tongensis]MBM7854083.1 protein subunit release factor A [Desulforadius tongensis]